MQYMMNGIYCWYMYQVSK